MNGILAPVCPEHNKASPPHGTCLGLDGPPVATQVRQLRFESGVLGDAPQIRNRLLRQCQSLAPEFGVVTVFDLMGFVPLFQAFVAKS